MAKSKEPENPKPIKEEKAKEVTKQSETSSSPLAVKKVSSKPKVSVDEVLRSKHLNDASKFHVFKELVQEGQMSNQEVVNSILYLVRKKNNNFYFSRCIFYPACCGNSAAAEAKSQTFCFQTFPSFSLVVWFRIWTAFEKQKKRAFLGQFLLSFCWRFLEGIWCSTKHETYVEQSSKIYFTNSQVPTQTSKSLAIRKFQVWFFFFWKRHNERRKKQVCFIITREFSRAYSSSTFQIINDSFQSSSFLKFSSRWSSPLSSSRLDELLAPE